MLSAAVALIRGWREGVRDQWSPGELQIDLHALRELLELWKRLGLDPGLLLYVLLGTEWIFRARPMTEEDMERELGKIESNLSKPDRPVLEPWQASLVVSALTPSLRKQMSGARYLVSLGRWTEPDRHRALDLLAHARSESPPPRRGPQHLLEGKTGPVPKVGPIVAALLAERMARQVTAQPVPRRSVGLAVARLLLCREVVSSEVLSWRRAILAAQPPAGYEERRRTRETEEKPAGARGQASFTVLDWLLERWRKNAEFALWAGFSADSVRRADKDPGKLFDLVAYPLHVSWLYSLKWSNRTRVNAS